MYPFVKWIHIMCQQREPITLLVASLYIPNKHTSQLYFTNHLYDSTFFPRIILEGIDNKWMEESAFAFTSSFSSLGVLCVEVEVEVILRNVSLSFLPFPPTLLSLSSPSTATQNTYHHDQLWFYIVNSSSSQKESFFLVLLNFLLLFWG